MFERANLTGFSRSPDNPDLVEIETWNRWRHCLSKHLVTMKGSVYGKRNIQSQW
jgi:hypothetical protein